MATIEELFKGNPDLTNKGKQDNPSNFAEQELDGIRRRSLVDINNPLIYGTDTTRIATRSTNTIELMYEGRNADLNDGGLIGQGIGKLTKGKHNSIADVRNKISDFLGLPQPMIPTVVADDLEKGMTLDQIEAKKNGTEFGKQLKQYAKGNPQTIVKQSLGGAIKFGKDKLRSTLFGSANNGLPALGNDNGFDGHYTSEHTYTTELNEIGYKEELGTVDALNTQTQQKFARESKVIDLRDVSPAYGVSRKSQLWNTDLGDRVITDKINNEGEIPDGLSPYSPLEPYTGTPGARSEVWNNSLENKYGLTNESDAINLASPSSENKKPTEELEALDLIPFWVGRYGVKDKVHFRALLSGINETVSPSWNSSNFFGNPFNFYTYSSIERSVTFSLMLYCSNPTELMYNWEKINQLTIFTYPSVPAAKDSGRMVNPPIIDFRLGDIYKSKVGFIESLSYTYPENGTWETDPTIGVLPKFIEVSISIKFIEQAGDNLSKLYDYKSSKEALKLQDEESGASTFSTKQTKDNPKKANIKPKVSVLANVAKPKGVAGNTLPSPSDDASALPNPNAGQSAIVENKEASSIGIDSLDSNGVVDTRSLFPFQGN